MIPKEFFVTSGRATSPVSGLNAFDLALKNAGIAQCNLVPVSSILPPECKERKWRKLPAGAITHAVVARMGGDEFAVLGIEAETNGDKMINRLSRRLAMLSSSLELIHPLSLSSGYAHYDPEYPRSIEDVLGEADARMYEQKEIKKIASGEKTRSY